MTVVADCICAAINGFDGGSKLAQVRDTVRGLCEKYPLYDDLIA